MRRLAAARVVAADWRAVDVTPAAPHWLHPPAAELKRWTATGVVAGRPFLRRLGGRMLYMVIEHFRSGEARPVYRRFRDHGRLLPEGVEYVASWVTADVAHCFQVMECANRAGLERWMAAWQDVIEFEVVPLITSAEALARLGPDL